MRTSPHLCATYSKPAGALLAALVSLLLIGDALAINECRKGGGVQPAGTLCFTAPAGSCQQNAVCDGVSRDCPSPAFKAAGTTCHTADPAKACDANSTCTGTSATCPDPIVTNITCHAKDPNNPCDVDVKCERVSTNCPPTPPVTNGNACTTDNNQCTSDVCHGLTCHHDPVANDCGTATCGSSPSGCFNCGTCAAGFVCTNGSCVAKDPCEGVVCGQCQKCSAGACVADSAKDGTGCIGESSGSCIESTCNAGTCRSETVDKSAPTITCPAPQTKECNGGNGTAQASVEATATDDCSTPTVSCAPNGLASYPLGTTSNTCTAIDGVGKTATCTTAVTVADTAPPMIACVEPKLVKTSEQGGLCSASLSVTASVTDACWNNLAASCSPATLSLSGGNGTASASCSASDGSNPSVTCNTSLTLKDDTNPTVTCPASVAVGEADASCNATIDPPTGTVADNCGVASAADPAASLFHGVGLHAVSYTTSDPAGNTASTTCNSVRIDDKTAPNLTVPANQTVVGQCQGSQDLTFTAVFNDVATATDNCSSATVTCSHMSGATLPLGTTTITCTASDEYGNSSTAMYTVTVLQPVRVAFRPPLSDWPVDNLFKVGSTVPHKIKLLSCGGVDLTNSLGPSLSVSLDVQQRTGSGSGSLVNDVPEAYNGMGDAGSLMVLLDGHFQYNLNTNGFVSGTRFGSDFFLSRVTATYNASLLPAGSGDARLESR